VATCVYEEVLWKKCDEVLSFFDRSSSIQELAGEGKASISDQISAYVRQTMAYEAWEAVCRKLHEKLKGWIVLLMFFASIILPLKPIHGGGPRSALMLFTLIPLGAVAILVANSPRHIANSRLWLHLLIYFLTVFAGCTVILMGTPERFSTQARPSERLLIVLPVILLWASGAALGVLALSRKNRQSAIGLFLAILALASILEAFPLRTWPWWVDDGLRIGLWMVVLSNLLFGLAVATDALIRTFISKRKHAKHPVSSIVSSLLSTTLAVEDGTTLAAEDGSAIEEISNRLPESPAREADVRDADAPLRAWQTIDFRREIAAQLERLAQRYERDLPRRLRTADVTDLWLHARGRGLANAVRQWKQDVLFPGRDTRDKLLRNLVTNLVHIAQGEWVRLEYTESVAVSPSLSARISTAVRNLVAAALPLAAVLAIRSGPIQVSDKFLDPLIPYAAAWFGIGILGWLVPESRGQVTGTAETISGITDRLRGP